MQLRFKNISIGTFVLFVLAACMRDTKIEAIKHSPTMTSAPVEWGKTIEQTPTAILVPIEQTATLEAEQSPWVLVWQDEFNEDHLSKDNWIASVNDWGGGNQEIQYYTNRKENAFVENGLLHIVGRKEHYRTRNFTSAMLTSTRSWTYGRFEVRAELPEGQGIWSAIWLRSHNHPYGPWAASGEIDIMEMLGHQPDVVYGTLHFGAPWPNNESQQGNTTLTSQGYHVFAVEWDVNEIRWYVDDVNYFRATSWHTSEGDYPAPFDQPFNIILNVAIGGVWPGNPDESTSFPQTLLIDYVRVYQK